MLKNVYYGTNNPSINMEINEQISKYIDIEKRQPLISELWAIRGYCDELRAQKIAKRAKLPSVKRTSKFGKALACR